MVGERHDAPMTQKPLRWPPPGLERIQGDLQVMAARAALAAGLLVLPMLFVVGLEQDFATFGPLADAWWVVIVLATVGLAFALDALARLARTVRRVGKALERGYDLRTVLRVLGDSGRDMGFLISGSRHFSVLSDTEREAVASIRVAAGILLAFGGFWLIFAFAVGLFVAARGGLTPLSLQGTVFLPAFIAFGCGGVAALVHEAMARKARKIFHRQPWAEDLVMEEIRGWQESVGGRAPSRLHASVARTLRVLGPVVGALAVVVVLPVLTLMPATAIGPILTSISAPNLDVYRPRAARAETFRSFRVDGDVTISPGEAGQLLHDLIWVGIDAEPPPGERPPSRPIAQPWLPVASDSGDNPFSLQPYSWGDSLFERIGSGVTPEQRAYLRGVAEHPAVPGFRRLARATALDAGSARWERPFPAGVTMATIPVPRFGPLRDATHARIGAAGSAFLEGRPDEAEQILREVISVGFLLADDGPTLIDNLIGLTLVEAGGSGLSGFYRAAGRTASAAELSRMVQVAEAGARLIPTDLKVGNEAWVRSLAEMSTDSTLARGLRWEYFINLTTLAPCLNVNRIVFGMGDEYTEYVARARESLVRWPSDEALFEIARHGWIGASEAGSATVFGRLAGLYMRTNENSCGRYVRHMQAAEVFN